MTRNVSKIETSSFYSVKPSFNHWGLYDFFRLKSWFSIYTVKILKFGTLQTIAIIVLKIEKFDVTLH